MLLTKTAALIWNLIPERLRGEVATFDIVSKGGTVIVESGRRITARNIRQIEKEKLKTLAVPEEYIVGPGIG